jgi:hypothetical protein
VIGCDDEPDTPRVAPCFSAVSYDGTGSSVYAASTSANGLLDVILKPSTFPK